MAVQVLAGYWDLDLKSRELLLCPRSRQMFGIDGRSPKKLGKQDWLPRIHPDDFPLVQDEIATAQRTNAIYAARFRAVRPDGSLCEILGVGRPDISERTRFVGLNFDLVAAATIADLESRRPGSNTVRFAKAPLVHPRPANENGAQAGRPQWPGRKKSYALDKGARQEAVTQSLLKRTLHEPEMRQLRDRLLKSAMFGQPSFDTLLAACVTQAASGVLTEKGKAHAARVDKLHEELGQRFTAISLAAEAIETGGDLASAVTLIRIAVEEARRELRLHRD